MQPLRLHVILTAVAVVVGLLSVFWVEPATTAGAGLIIVVCFVIINAVGALTGWLFPRRRVRLKRNTRSG